MSFYPKEGNPLWGKYSTEVVAHTIKTYSKFSVDYPYPVAIFHATARRWDGIPDDFFQWRRVLKPMALTRKALNTA
jgi:hypothetical protein